MISGLLSANMNENSEDSFFYLMVRLNKYGSRFAVVLVISALVMSCENKVDSLPKSEILSLPSLSARNFQTIFNDSGKMQLFMSAPIAEQYDNKEEPYSEFIAGIKGRFL